MITRRRSITLLCGGLALASCSGGSINALRIGSDSSAENATIAEIYGLVLTRADVAVTRRVQFGGSADALRALSNGEIDLYPAHVGSDTLCALRESDKSRYEKQQRFTWLSPSPVSDSPCLVTSQYAAEQYSLLTLTTCAKLAPQLRFAGTFHFVAPGGPLQRLRRTYGGFDFKRVIACEPGTQYYTLNRGEADVADGFTTDPNISEDQLVILRDEKRFWRQCRIAPVIRLSALAHFPRARGALDGISQALTAFAVQQMNMRASLLDMEPRDLAEDFVAAHERRKRGSR